MIERVRKEAIFPRYLKSSEADVALLCIFAAAVEDGAYDLATLRGRRALLVTSRRRELISIHSGGPPTRSSSRTSRGEDLFNNTPTSLAQRRAQSTNSV